MAENTTEVLVGGAVLALAIGFGIYAGKIAGLAPGGAGYPLTASFRAADGIQIGTDVRLAGVKVGTVTDIALNPESYRAIATFSVSDGVKVPDDSAVLISSEGLLGGNYLELSPGGSEFYLESGDEVLETQGSISLVALLMKFVTKTGE
ncbi:outer membrane lipid asymmetry maintenance protein MlaD [Pseudooceanicola sp.]|uniref:outer membrane lipid asymmetry maintenance protein MlaD n=1 Tax=Pseudooceanicola sp. TaxID=1914328 RepID=UPI00263520A2|nr:outer membrane lipid asymmetry maintenance protein MlaD [Pseudooceanicola sp.]MDF1854873.1 outer membrane lipid asymmetry maintenance protein MlaD [Pseudooceanicola sp.]